jgi:hypothetical protein
VGQTVKEFKIKYTTGDPLSIYMQMLRSFATPLSLMQAIPHHETFSTIIQPPYSSTKG